MELHFNSTPHVDMWGVISADSAHEAIADRMQLILLDHILHPEDPPPPTSLHHISAPSDSNFSMEALIFSHN